MPDIRDMFAIARAQSVSGASMSTSSEAVSHPPTLLVFSARQCATCKLTPCLIEDDKEEAEQNIPDADTLQLDNEHVPDPPIVTELPTTLLILFLSFQWPSMTLDLPIKMRDSHTTSLLSLRKQEMMEFNSKANSAVEVDLNPNLLLEKDHVAERKLAELDLTLPKEIGSQRGHPVAVETLASWLDKIGASLCEKLGNSAAAILDSDAIVVWDPESDGVGGTHSLELTCEWVFRKLLTVTIWTNSGINLTDDDEDGTDQYVEIPEEVNEKCRADVAKLTSLLILLKALFNIFNNENNGSLDHQIFWFHFVLKSMPNCTHQEVLAEWIKEQSVKEPAAIEAALEPISLNNIKLVLPNLNMQPEVDIMSSRLDFLDINHENDEIGGNSSEQIPIQSVRHQNQGQQRAFSA
ncbi:hypothetical protein BC830DRAFT_1177464 [Chytriomyces sp. MP71]|nr:hypothetical protein BC830DRAFT_1177464 [Chytriomyces sp. MP71]